MLVDCDDVTPNIPDMQKQLQKSLADYAIKKAIRAYSDVMSKYLDGCAVYNDDEDGDILDFSGAEELQGVAEEMELRAHSQQTLVQLMEDMHNEITSQSMYEKFVEELKTRCTVDDKPSIFAQLSEENRKRSQASCDLLARKVYGKFRVFVRAKATEMTQETFEDGFKNILVKFLQVARGPCVQETIITYLKEQQEIDKVFLEKVRELDSVVQEKAALVNKLEKNLEETTHIYKDEIERMNMKMQEEIKALQSNHAKEMAEALTEQKAVEAARLAALTEEMNLNLQKAIEQKNAEIEALNAEAEARLTNERRKLEEELKLLQEQHSGNIERVEQELEAKMQQEALENSCHVCVIM